jgi:aminoglycoside phosphotransferase (APT) family kinase protein
MGGTTPPDVIIQHGDFGPNNLIFDPGSLRVAAVLDWEFSGVGPAITDIAWCEWIVRMHHPHAVNDLSVFFDAYGVRPAWSERQREMVRRCTWFEHFCRRWDAQDAAAVWRDRTAIVADWAE